MIDLRETHIGDIVKTRNGNKLTIFMKDTEVSTNEEFFLCVPIGYKPDELNEDYDLEEFEGEDYLEHWYTSKGEYIIGEVNDLDIVEIDKVSHRLNSLLQEGNNEN